MYNFRPSGWVEIKPQFSFKIWLLAIHMPPSKVVPFSSSIYNTQRTKANHCCNKRMLHFWTTWCLHSWVPCAVSDGHGVWVWRWHLRTRKAHPDLPAVSLRDFLDGYSHLVAQVSSSIHDPICAFPQHDPIAVCIVVILILKKAKQQDQKAHNLWWSPIRA